MRTDVDTALKDLADWYVKNKRGMTNPEFQSILLKHCGSEAEVVKFVKFLDTEPGQVRFKIHLRERKEAPSTLKEPQTGWGEPFVFRGLKFREHSGGIGIQVYHPEQKKWYDIEGLNWRTSKDYYSHLPDIGLWQNRRYFGSIRFPEPPLGESSAKPSLLYEGNETEAYGPLGVAKGIYEPEACQIVSPEYDYLLGLLDSVPHFSLLLEPEVKERKIDEILKKLRDGVDSIIQSAVFREFLFTMSKFWEYSVGNQILIMLQSPTATRVAGFYTWKDLGRYVKKGERGIAILAPCLPPKEARLRCPICVQGGFTEESLRRHLTEFHKEVDVSDLIEVAKEELALQPLHFKVVYVFDVSQTEGKPLPEVKVPVLTGAANEELFTRVLAHDKKQGLAVSFESRPQQDPEIKGMYFGRTIWVRPEESRAQQLKTLIHETAHYYTETVFFIPRADAETIAESSAFAVGAHFGFDSGARSFPYVAIWSKDKKVLDKNLNSVRKVTVTLIDALEKEK